MCSSDLELLLLSNWSGADQRGEVTPAVRKKRLEFAGAITASGNATRFPLFCLTERLGRAFYCHAADFSLSRSGTSGSWGALTSNTFVTPREISGELDSAARSGQLICSLVDTYKFDEAVVANISSVDPNTQS